MAKLLSNWSIILILFITSFFSSPSHLYADEEKMGHYFPAEPGLQEINTEKKTAIKWKENTRIVFLPGPKGLPGGMHMIIYREKKILFKIEGRFWRYFEAKDFPYKKCSSLIVRNTAEGHNPDSFIALVRFPDGKLMVYVIESIWSEESVDLIKNQEQSDTKLVHLTFGSYSTCADRFTYSRAAVFDKNSLEWRLDKRGELPAFYLPQINEVEANIQRLLHPVSYEDISMRKYGIPALVFESALYRYMMGESLESVAKNLFGRFTFSAEERYCVNAMIQQVDEQLKFRSDESVATKYRPGTYPEEENDGVRMNLPHFKKIRK